MSCDRFRRVGLNDPYPWLELLSAHYREWEKIKNPFKRWMHGLRVEHDVLTTRDLIDFWELSCDHEQRENPVSGQ